MQLFLFAKIEFGACGNPGTWAIINKIASWLVVAGLPPGFPWSWAFTPVDFSIYPIPGPGDPPCSHPQPILSHTNVRVGESDSRRAQRRWNRQVARHHPDPNRFLAFRHTCDHASLLLSLNTLLFKSEQMRRCENTTTAITSGVAECLIKINEFHEQKNHVM